MEIGIIGATGEIAKKAYLPVYSALQAEHDFVIYSRDLEKAEEVARRYHFPKATNVLANLDFCDMVFIHAATSAHFELAKHFLELGIPVIMDKPISESISETRELVELAASKKILFVIGFNRRFVPGLQELKDLPEKTFIKVTKNLPAMSDKSVKFSMYDMFIHPLDTLIYLLDDEIVNIETQLVTKNDRLQRAIVFLQTPSTTGIASMNFEAGAFQEEFTVEAKSATKRLTDLAERVTFDGFDIQTGHFHGWESAPYVRGFERLIKSSIAAVEGENVDLKQRNVVKSHEIIAEMLKQQID